MRQERGQVSILLALVMVLLMVLAVGIAIIGDAIVHRARARTAADAVALASAVDPAGGDALGDWYRERGIAVEVANARAHAFSGPSQAAAWASVESGEVVVAPALVAIVARAAQLLGRPLSPLALQGTRVGFDGETSTAVATIANELALCPAPTTTDTPTVNWYELC